MGANTHFDAMFYTEPDETFILAVKFEQFGRLACPFQNDDLGTINGDLFGLNGFGQLHPQIGRIGDINEQLSLVEFPNRWEITACSNK